MDDIDSESFLNDMQDSSLEAPLPEPSEMEPLPHRRLIGRLHDLAARKGEDGEQVYLLVLAVIVGLAMGAICALFRYLINLSFSLFFAGAAGHGGPAAAPEGIGDHLVRLGLPGLGGLVVGFFVYRLMKLTGGHGVPSVMRAVATGNINLSPVMALKSSTSIVTITSGGSCGPEGPIIEIGSVVGSMVGREAQVSKERVGTLIGCGAASGIAGVFNAPIGGVFLALELLMRDFQVRTFGPVVVAAVMASVTSEALLPNSPVFPATPAEVIATVDSNYAQILMFAALGLIAGLAGVLLVYLLYRGLDFFQSVRLPMWVKPALGGLMVGIIGLFFPTVIGEGYEFVCVDILEHYARLAPGQGVELGAALFFLFIGVVKILATTMTLGSGGTGGSFAPAMVLGAMVGAGTGVLCNLVFPSAAPAVSIFALVGMAGTVCSALGAPIAGILIVYEVSGANYRLVLPLMVTVAVSALVSSMFRQGSVYTLSLLRDGFNVDRVIPKSLDPLARIPVTEIMKREFIRVRPNDNLARMIDAFTLSEDDAFAVTDERGHLIGMVSTRDLRGVLTLAGVGEAIIAADAADMNPPVLYPDTPASEAMAIFARTEISGIPVLARRGSRRIVGMVHRVNVLGALRGAAAGT